MKNTVFRNSRLSSVLVAFLALSSFGLAQQKMQPAGRREDQSTLVQTVREATKQYVDINNATADGYGQFLGCVSGSDHGAMGVHYINFNLVNGTIDAKHPQALIYEPANGQMKLVGVEFIVDQATWLKNNNNVPPVLEGTDVFVNRCSQSLWCSGSILRASRLGVAGQPHRAITWTGTTM